MKEFIKQLFIFLIPFVMYSIIAMTMMPYLLSLQNGPSTKQQIKLSFEYSINKNYELLILGNSRTYRGLNPDIFTWSCFNFSHDNDSYNQIYYKLKKLLDKQKKFNYLILGVDYFQFSFKSDTRNYVYADFFSNEYLKDFNNSNIFLEKIEYYLGNINPKKLLSLKQNEDKPFLRENGQYIKQGIATESDFIKRDINCLDFQVTYFKRILNLCKTKKIKVFIVMLPTRKNELSSYSEFERNKFNSFIDEFTDNTNVYYLNYSENKDFKTADYSDITHFNESASNKFSKILNNDLLQLTNKNK